MAQIHKPYRPGMHQPIGDCVFTINRLHEGQYWHLYDIDVRHGKANQWTKYPSKALTFSTEKEAKEIIERYNLPSVSVGTLSTGG